MIDTISNFKFGNVSAKCKESKIGRNKTRLRSEAYREFVAPAFLHELLLNVEDLPDGPWDDAALSVVLLDAGTALHGVGLTAASLTVGEHTDVVAVQRGLKEKF